MITFSEINNGSVHIKLISSDGDSIEFYAQETSILKVIAFSLLNKIDPINNIKPYENFAKKVLNL
jgi:hypothetical protein